MVIEIGKEKLYIEWDYIVRLPLYNEFFKKVFYPISLLPENGDGNWETEAVDPDEDVDELRQDETADQPDVVGHREDK